MNADPATQSVLWLIKKQGYSATVESTRVVAVADDRETFIVTGDDPYINACKLAQKIGIELEDG